MRNLLFLILLLSSVYAKAQDIHFSQYQFAPLNYNPGMNGSFNGDFNVGLNWKDQWRGIDKTFQTFSFSFEHNILKGQFRNAYFTYGILAYRDIAGEVKYGTTNVMGNLSGTIKLDKSSKLTGGIQAGWGSRGIDVGAMRWGSQYDGLNYDPTISSGENSNFDPVNYLDASMGISYWYYRPSTSYATNDKIDIKVGLACNHINRPSIGYFENETDRLAMKWALHGSFYFGIQNSYWGVEPTFLVLNQGAHKEILVGGWIKYNLKNASTTTGYNKPALIGFGITNRFASPYDALIPQMILEMYDFTLGISYDVNLSRLSPASNFRGGFEISIRYTHPDKFYYSHPKKITPNI